MTSLPPRTHLGTHEVFNQPTPLEDVNLYDGDQFLRRAVREAGGKDHETALSSNEVTDSSYDNWLEEISGAIEQP